MPTSPRVSRRDVLGIAAATAITGTIVGVGGWRISQRPVLSPGDAAGAGGAGTRNPLAVPPLATPTLAADGAKTFELAARAGTTDFVSGSTTPTWGYNGSFGGPTIRATTGERVRIAVRNELDETTTAHWHGAKLPAAADGGPHQPIHPGESWTAEWTIEQPAATLWYHPHNHGTTEAHVYRGLAGLLLVDDPGSPEQNPLPHDYGVDDVPLIITDRSFARDGSFDESRRDAAGMLGDTILVNGTVSPRFEAGRAETRFRILNASTARSYRLQLDRSPMLLVGTDNGLLPEPVEIRGITLTPGERAEVVVRLEPGQRAMLRSLPHALGLLGTTERASGTRDRFDILEIERVTGVSGGGSNSPLADRLAAAGGSLAAALPEPDEPDARRTVTLQNDTINHRAMNMRRIDEVVTVGSRERWFITNEHFLPHNLHIHNARFLVRSIGGQEPAPELRGWKDTVYAPPSRTVVVDVEFGTATDPHRPYMFHCHLLQHEDQGMMAQFVVVKPGEQAGPLDTPITRDGGSHDGH